LIICLHRWIGLSDYSIEAGVNNSEYNDAQPVNLPLDIPKPTNVTYLDFDDPFSLIDQASGAPHVSRLSSLAWVGCGKYVYVLECLSEGFIRIDALEESSSGA
jgi:ATP-dependent helicase IRC3